MVGSDAPSCRMDTGNVRDGQGGQKLLALVLDSSFSQTLSPCSHGAWSGSEDYHSADNSSTDTRQSGGGDCNLGTTELRDLSGLSREPFSETDDSSVDLPLKRAFKKDSGILLHAWRSDQEENGDSDGPTRGVRNTIPARPNYSGEALSPSGGKTSAFLKLLSLPGSLKFAQETLDSGPAVVSPTVVSPVANRLGSVDCFSPVPCPPNPVDPGKYPFGRAPNSLCSEDRSECGSDCPSLSASSLQPSSGDFDFTPDPWAVISLPNAKAVESSVTNDEVSLEDTSQLQRPHTHEDKTTVVLNDRAEPYAVQKVRSACLGRDENTSKLDRKQRIIGGGSGSAYETSELRHGTPFSSSVAGFESNKQRKSVYPACFNAAPNTAVLVPSVGEVAINAQALLRGASVAAATDTSDSANRADWQQSKNGVVSCTRVSGGAGDRETFNKTDGETPVTSSSFGTLAIGRDNREEEKDQKVGEDVFDAMSVPKLAGSSVAEGLGRQTDDHHQEDGLKRHWQLPEGEPLPLRVRSSDACSLCCGDPEVFNSDTAGTEDGMEPGAPPLELVRHQANMNRLSTSTPSPTGAQSRAETSEFALPGVASRAPNEGSEFWPASGCKGRALAGLLRDSRDSVRFPAVKSATRNHSRHQTSASCGTSWNNQEEHIVPKGVVARAAVRHKSVSALCLDVTTESSAWDGSEDGELWDPPHGLSEDVELWGESRHAAYSYSFVAAPPAPGSFRPFSEPLAGPQRDSSPDNDQGGVEVSLADPEGVSSWMERCACRNMKSSPWGTTGRVPNSLLVHQRLALWDRDCKGMTEFATNKRASVNSRVGDQDSVNQRRGPRTGCVLEGNPRIVSKKEKLERNGSIPTVSRMFKNVRRCVQLLCWAGDRKAS